MSSANSVQESVQPIPFPQFTRIRLDRPYDNVLEVILNDSKRNNPWNDVLFNEFIECFRIIASHNDINVVLLTASPECKHFTVGLGIYQYTIYHISYTMRLHECDRFAMGS